MFIVKKNNKNIRIGEINTKHGIINTPCFVPVATNACIKTCDSETINKIGVDLVFCNTYHLMVHPGENIIKNAGGIHSFMNRKHPIITDSGGFQIFSLMYGGVTNELKSKGKKKIENSIIKINEDGAIFRSYRDGSSILMTPESSIIAQKKIGADIIIPLDELLPFHVNFETFKVSFYKTHRWQIRSLEEHKKNKQEQFIYGIIHGNMYEEFRKKSCKIISNLDFDGYAIGGSFGNCKKDVIEVIKLTVNNLPSEKPKHLLGIADLETIKEALSLGIDSFDSSYPTKCARHGVLFSDNGYIKIKQGKWKACYDFISNAPIVKEYTAAYIHHLFKTSEQTAGMLASIHNIWYLNEYCKNLKK